MRQNRRKNQAVFSIAAGYTMVIDGESGIALQVRSIIKKKDRV